MIHRLRIAILFTRELSFSGVRIFGDERKRIVVGIFCCYSRRLLQLLLVDSSPHFFALHVLGKQYSHFSHVGGISRLCASISSLQTSLCLILFQNEGTALGDCVGKQPFGNHLPLSLSLSASSACWPVASGGYQQKQPNDSPLGLRFPAEYPTQTIIGNFLSQPSDVVDAWRCCED